MKKLATLQYDVTDLVTAGQIDYLIEVTKGKDELVKNAHIPSLEETEEMPDEKFALILYHPHIGKMKKLAMSDKYITELNMRIFEDRINSLPEKLVKVAAYHLAKAAKYYKLTVPESIKKYAEEKPVSNWVNIAELKATSVKVASENIKYALGNKYPIHTAQLVKKAMSYFADHWKRFSPLNAFEYAVNVKIAADKLGVDYKGTRIEKYAHISPAKLSPLFKAAVAARKGYVTEDNRQIFDDLIKEASTLGTVKTAKALEAIDRELGLNREWNKSIEDPVFTVFDTTVEKTARESGTEINLESLRKLPNGLVDDATLKDLKSDEGLEVFASLPTPVRQKLAKAMETDERGKGGGIVDKVIPTQNRPTKSGNPTKDEPTSKVLSAIDNGMKP
jgi:hypothetical protein